MQEQFEILKQVAEVLEKINVPYMVTGSFAANFYAIPRMTRDIDIVLEILSSDREKVFNAFSTEFYVDKNAMSQAVEHEGMFNIIHTQTIIKIDFIVRKDSEYRHIEFQRKQRVHFNDIPIWIASPEDLIISKLYWAKDSLSEMQIKDVKGLFGSVKNLDVEYIKKWVQRFKLDFIYERVISNE